MLPLTQGSGARPGQAGPQAYRLPQPWASVRKGGPLWNRGASSSGGEPGRGGQKAPCRDDTASPWAGGTGAAGHVEPLLAPHPQCPRKRLSLSLSLRPVRWPRRCPTG